MAQYLKKNKQTANAKALQRAKRSIVWQAGLAGTTVLLTVVLLFAMTSAWYTNIVQTSGLTFQAEAWGFDGIIDVQEAAVQAAPGDEGNVYLEVANTSNSVSSVSVGVSKARITDLEMRKRLFFYVDTQLIREGETMERVYLSTVESYTYTLFAQDTLTLTEDMHSDAPLKWQWVYDMLGYYVLGSWDENKTHFTETEYLRPIEYDFDEATFAMVEDEDGVTTMEMKTVDGETSMEDFLVNLSKTDGYQGQIDPEQGKNGYYPVDVDENGYGVYAYLCSYSDIELATQYDTKLGQDAAKYEAGVEDVEPPVSCPVQLTVSAQKNDENFITIDTVAGLQTALQLEADTTLQLKDDLTLTENDVLAIPAGKRIVLDLNGNTLTSSAATSIVASPGSSLTIVNGDMKAEAGSGAQYAVYSVGAEVTFSHVTMEGFQFGVYIKDIENNNTLDTRCRLVNCKIKAESVAVFASGNGSDSAQNTQVVIENCELEGKDYALCGNGNAVAPGRWGTDIQVINSTLASDPNNPSAGIFHPQKGSTLTLYKAKVSGYTGMVVKGGEVTVIDSEIHGSGTWQQPAYSGGGFTDTGDAIYVETNYGYDITVTVRGDSLLNSLDGWPLEVYEEDKPNVSVTVYSAKVTSNKGTVPEKYLAKGSSLEEKNVIAPEAAE